MDICRSTNNKDTYSCLLVSESKREEPLLHLMEVTLIIPCRHTVVLSLRRAKWEETDKTHLLCQ